MEPRVLKFVAGVVAAFFCGYGTQHGLTQRTGSSPFSISIVPSWSSASGAGISMAGDVMDSFYVILANTSHQPEAVFVPGNSWGYYSISFELETGTGKVIKIAKRPQAFTKNTPVTFVIPQGEQMVFPIKLNDDWEANSALPTADENPIPLTVKAIYDMRPTPESSTQKVWIGHLESRSYYLSFRHWLPRRSAQKCP